MAPTVSYLSEFPSRLFGNRHTADFSLGTKFNLIPICVYCNGTYLMPNHFLTLLPDELVMQ